MTPLRQLYMVYLIGEPTVPSLFLNLLHPEIMTIFYIFLLLVFYMRFRSCLRRISGLNTNSVLLHAFSIFLHTGAAARDL